MKGDLPLSFYNKQTEVKNMEEKHHCERCGRELSADEYALYDGLCSDCYETEQDEEDMEEDD